jgi:ribonucleoside-diphosphate reductase alpha chain
MYYLRTKSAVDAIKFTLDTKKKEAPKTELGTAPQVLEKQKKKAANTAQKFSKQASMDAEVEPMSAEEMKALIEQAKASEGDDCLMCGS